MGSKLNVDFAGEWRSLFVHGLSLMREMRLRTRPDALWTFGGGTVLMLRHAHRLSKDIVKPGEGVEVEFAARVMLPRDEALLKARMRPPQQQ